jgi:hypothetical protein
MMVVTTAELMASMMALQTVAMMVAMMALMMALQTVATMVAMSD